MRYGILSDIHGNLEALDAVLQACKDEGVRKYLCAGDLVGYGADPSECVGRIRAVKACCVAGNHDWAVAGQMDYSDFVSSARQSVAWTRSALPREDIDFLKSLQLVYQRDGMTMVHGSLNHPEKFIYMYEIEQAMDTFFQMETPVCFVGHTHIAKVFIQKDQKIGFGEKAKLYLNEDCKYVVNVGSVGQPRDGYPTAAFAIYDPDLKWIKLKRVAYDIGAAQQKIINSGLPAEFADRLSIGQ